MASSGIAKRRATAKAEASKHYVSRRNDLIRAAALVFKSKGLSETSIDDIAQAAGVDRASLYYYVASKQELFEEVVYGAVLANIETAEKILASDDPAPEKLKNLIEQVMIAYGEHFPHIYVYVQEDAARIKGSGKNKGRIQDLQRRFDRALIAIIEEGIESGEFRSDISPRITAFGVIGMFNWSHRWFTPDGPVSAKEVGKEFADLATSGLVPR